MIQRWDIITIGNLSRNRYWGEGDERAVRPALCTSTLIAGEGFRLLIDPPYADAQRMAAELDRRTGLRLSDVGTVFVTHAHSDHHDGLASFPDAMWLAAPGVAEAINGTGRHTRPVEPCGQRIFEDIRVLLMPGHTPDHHGFLFECEGLTVAVAGDAVMTREFWEHRQGYWNSWDFELAARTMDELAGMADIIVPGHDNYFLTLRKG